MPDTGWLSPSTGTNVSAGLNLEDWVNPGNITADDGSYATASIEVYWQDTNWIVATGFGSAVPAGATVNGIEARITAANTGGRAGEISHYQLYNDGFIGTLFPIAEALPNSGDGVYTYGGPSDTLGAALTDSVVNSPNFGIGFRFGNRGTTSSPTNVVGVDLIEIRIHYTVNEAPSVTSGPTISYTAYGKISPNNTGTVTFTASDADAGDQGSDALSFEIRTAASGGGTLVTSGNCTHGVQEQVVLTAAQLQAAGVPEDTATTLYLRVSDDEPDVSPDYDFAVTAIYPHEYEELTGETLVIVLTEGSYSKHVVDESGLTTVVVSTEGQQSVFELSGQTVVAVDTDGSFINIDDTGETLVLVQTDGVSIWDLLDLSGESVVVAVTEGSSFVHDLGGESVVLSVTDGSEIANVLELDGQSLILAQVDGFQTVVDRGGESVVLFEMDGFDILARFEIDGETVILAQVSGDDRIDQLDLGGESTVLVITDGSQHWQEPGDAETVITAIVSGTQLVEETRGETVVLVETSGLHGWLELLGETVVLAETSGTQRYSESSGESVAIVVTSGTEQKNETSSETVVRVLMDGTQFVRSLSGQTLVLTQVSGSDGPILLDGETVVRAVTDGENAYVELGGESLILVSMDGEDLFLEATGESLVLVRTEGAQSVSDLSGETVVRVENSGYDIVAVFELDGETVVVVETDGENVWARVSRYPLELSYLGYSDTPRISVVWLNPFRVTLSESGPFTVTFGKR